MNDPTGDASGVHVTMLSHTLSFDAAGKRRESQGWWNDASRLYRVATSQAHELAILCGHPVAVIAEARF